MCIRDRTGRRFGAVAGDRSDPALYLARPRHGGDGARPYPAGDDEKDVTRAISKAHLTWLADSHRPLSPGLSPPQNALQRHRPRQSVGNRAVFQNVTMHQIQPCICFGAVHYDLINDLHQLWRRILTDRL